MGMELLLQIATCPPGCVAVRTVSTRDKTLAMAPGRQAASQHRAFPASAVTDERFTGCLSAKSTYMLVLA